MLKYYKIETDESSPNYNFIESFKELWRLIDKTELSKYIVRDKIYDLYPLRNWLEDSDNSK